MEKNFVKIFLVGDPGVGKTTLIKSLIYESFQPQVVEVALNPVNEKINQIDTQIIDSDVKISVTEAALKCIDPKDSAVVCIIYSSDSEESKQNAINLWIPMIRRLPTPVPMVLVSHKKLNDAREEEEIIHELDQMFKSCKDVEYGTYCEASELSSIREMFDIAQRIAMFPASKLVYHDINGNEVMKSAVSQALSFVFRQADIDADGHLSTNELNQLQANCFTDGELDQSTLQKLKTATGDDISDGFDSKGFTVKGFVSIWKLMISKGRFEAIWVILRHFGFEDDLTLAVANRPLPNLGTAVGREYILSDSAINFLTDFFKKEVSRTGSEDGTLKYEHLKSIQDFLRCFEQIHDSSEALKKKIKLLLDARDKQLELDEKDQLSPSESQELSKPIEVENKPAVDETSTSLPEISYSSTSFPWNQFASLPESVSQSDPLKRSISLEGWLDLWHLATFSNPKKVHQMIAYLGFGAKRVSPLIVPTSKVSDIAQALQVVETNKSPYCHVVVLGLPSSGRTSFIRGLLNLPFEKSLSLDQRINIGTISIIRAASVWLKSPVEQVKEVSVSKPKRSKLFKDSDSEDESDDSFDRELRRKKQIKAKQLKDAPKENKDATAVQTIKRPAYRTIKPTEKGVFIFEKQSLDQLSQVVINKRRTDLTVVIIDLSREQDFERIESTLTRFHNADPKLPILIVGTKSDVASPLQEKIRAFANDRNLPVPIFISSKVDDYGEVVPAMWDSIQAGRQAVSPPGIFSEFYIEAIQAYAIMFLKDPLVVQIVVGGLIVFTTLSINKIWGPIFPKLWGVVKYGAVALYNYLNKKKSDWYLRWRLSVLDNLDGIPQEAVDMINRKPFVTTPILPGSDQRLGLQR